MNNISALDGGTFFLQNIDDVYVADRSEAEVSVSVNNETIFTETLFAEEDGCVYLRNIPELLRPYATPGTNSVSVAFGSNTRTFTVIYSNSLISGSEGVNASQWVNNHFLSSADEKRLAENSTERIAACGSSMSQMSYQCLFMNAAGVKRVVSGSFAQLPTLSHGNGYTVFNVSPRRMKGYGDGDTLLGYAIILGNRRIRYTIDRTLAGRTLRFSFVNAFGIEEDITIPGVILSSRSVDRIEAVHLGVRKTINPKLNVTHKVRTGVLTDAEMTLLSELVSSAEIKVISENDTAINVVLADNPKIEPTTDLTKYGTAEFSFRYAKNDRRIGPDAVKGSRIFDDSFDETYE